MARVGRNDPCPCGSGKKYKNCCLKKDRARRIRDSAWRREEQVTLDKLITFAQRPALSTQLVAAFNLFWNGSYGVEGWNALDRDEIGRFLDWYVHDYRLERSRERIVDLFMEEMGIDRSVTNVNGGAIAFGHPLGATGAMLLGTMVDELERRDLNTALVTLCVGAGMGTSTIIERV